MKEPRQPSPDDPTVDLADETAVAELLRAAGPRPTVDPRHLEQVRDAVRPVWRTAVERRTSPANEEHAPAPQAIRQEPATPRRPRSAARWLLPIAAMLALAVGWKFLPRDTPTAPPTVATVELLRGELTLVGSPTPLTVGDPIPDAAVLETHHGTVALRLADGTSLRMAEASRLRFADTSHLVLERGAVYADTGAPHTEHPATPTLAVETPLGTAWDIGTQFEVRLGPDALRVRVREGRVDLVRDAARHPIAAGRQLEVDTAGSVRDDPVALHGDPWSWVVKTAPPFELEGRRVNELLAWVARETGTTVHWHEPSLADTAGQAIAHGSVDGLSPIEALAVVPPASGLEAQIVGAELWVGPAGPSVP